MPTETTRRAIFGSAGLAAVALAVPALATASSTSQMDSPAFKAALDGADAARDHFNAAASDLEDSDSDGFECLMQDLCDATAAGDAATPTNWQEFTRLLAHMSEGGQSTIDDDNAARLLGHARRLSGWGA
ncbi:hypothetical protein [Sphingomonas carotinifaciens]|uniref:hypothetical protein n=1 Tax=Sphingomonas carotinifaciens TaxID=1166323 RepID=UPI0012379F6F|nr:hypothetical protein [Sphingomonas carotinifaciens]